MLEVGNQKGTKVKDALAQVYKEVYKTLQVKHGVHLHTLDLADTVGESDPKGWKNARKSAYKAYWLKAAYEEMVTIVCIRVFTLTNELPLGRKALLTKWIFITRKDVLGKIVKFQVKWVAREDLQRKDIDCKETFATMRNF